MKCFATAILSGRINRWPIGELQIRQKLGSFKLWRGEKIDLNSGLEEKELQELRKPKELHSQEKINSKKIVVVPLNL